MTRTLRFAIKKTDGIKRADVCLSKVGKYYHINLCQYDKEGYYQAQKSRTVIESSDFDYTNKYFDDILGYNKMEEIKL